MQVHSGTWEMNHLLWWPHPGRVNHPILEKSLKYREEIELSSILTPMPIPTSDEIRTFFSLGKLKDFIPSLKITKHRRVTSHLRVLLHILIAIGSYSCTHRVLAFQDRMAIKAKFSITWHKKAYLKMIYHTVGVCTSSPLSQYYKSDRALLVWLTWRRRKSLLLTFPVCSTRTLDKIARSCDLVVI